MSISAQARTALFLVGAGGLLFGSAGTFSIPAFWLYLATLTAVFIISLVMLDPELLHERMLPGGRALPFGVMLATLVFSLHWVVAGLDRGRFHLSDTVPLPLQAVGFLVFAAGQVLAFWAMRVNRFFSSIVRIQSDRGQYVVTAGPYTFVRHPGYAGGHPGHSGERHRTRLMACGRFCACHQCPIHLAPIIHRRSGASGAVSRLPRLCAAGALAPAAADLVNGGGQIGVPGALLMSDSHTRHYG